MNGGDSSGVLYATACGHSVRLRTNNIFSIQVASSGRAFLSQADVFSKLDLVFVELVLATGVVVANWSKLERTIWSNVR